MENPATWGPVEKVIDGVMMDIYQHRREYYRRGLDGPSMAHRITQALEAAGLLRQDSLAACRDCAGPLAITKLCRECGAVNEVTCLSCLGAAV